MTVAETRTREFSVNDLVKRAYRRAGLLNEHMLPSQQQAADAREELELIIDALELEGLMVRSVIMEHVVLEAGTASYTLPDHVLDVIGEAKHIRDGEELDRASGETVIQAIPRADWQGISAKNATGLPSLYYPDRSGSQVVVHLWPIPDAAGTARFQVHRLRADNDVGLATPDVERHWGQYLVYELAHKLALSRSLPLPRCQMLAVEAARYLTKAKLKSNEHQPRQIHLTHRTQWSR